MCTLNTIIDIFNSLSSFLTPIIAVFVAIIAANQYKVQKDKLKLDLYEKRFKIYLEISIVFNLIFHNRTISTDQLNNLRVGVFGYEFLFGKEIVAFIDELIITSDQLVRNEDRGKTRFTDVGIDVEVETLKILKDNLLKWFKDHESFNSLFEKYLTFKNLY